MHKRSPNPALLLVPVLCLLALCLANAAPAQSPVRDTDWTTGVFGSSAAGGANTTTGAGADWIDVAGGVATAGSAGKLTLTAPDRAFANNQVVVQPLSFLSEREIYYHTGPGNLFAIGRYQGNNTDYAVSGNTVFVINNGGLSTPGVSVTTNSAATPAATDLIRWTTDISGTSPTTITVTQYNVTTGTLLTTATCTDSTGPQVAGQVGFMVNNASFTVNRAQVINLTGPAPAIFADNPAVNYIGKWATLGTGSGSKAVTLGSGNSINLALTGTHTCQLFFDVSNCVAAAYPVIAYQADGGAWTRATLDGTGVVSVAFPSINGASFGAYTSHTLSVVMDGLAETSGRWLALQNIPQFTGVSLDAGGSLLTVPANPNTIQFDGDSITEDFFLLSQNTPYQTYKAAHAAWPYLTAQALGMGAVVAGYTGNGEVETAGASTAPTDPPLAGGVWGKVSAGTPYAPAVPPVVEVVAYGTNDANTGVATSAFTAAYAANLNQARGSYPNAVIECVALPSMSGYVAAISSLISARNDGRIRFHDYTGLWTSADTTDNIHPNPGGGVKLAARLSADIKADLASLGIKTQAASAGVAPQGGQIKRGR